jgi:hypothetical protein
MEEHAQLEPMLRLYARLRHEHLRCHMHGVSWRSLGDGGVSQPKPEPPFSIPVCPIANLS